MNFESAKCMNLSTRFKRIEEYQRSARRVRNRKTGGARRNRTVASSRLKRQEFSQLSADKNKSPSPFAAPVCYVVCECYVVCDRV